MKGIAIVLAYAAMATLAFGQARTDSTNSGPPTTVETGMTGHHGVGTVDGFNPGEYISVTTGSQTQPVKYVLGKAVLYEDRSGATVKPTDIRAGAKVSLEFDANNQVSRVIVVDRTGEK